MSSRGFTLVEVLVALIVVALGFAALAGTIGSSARGSEHLRDKLFAEWIAMNRITEVRLKTSSFGTNSDKGEVDFAKRRWRYDTRYIETQNPNIRQIDVRVWFQDDADKAAPVAEAMSFLGTAIAAPGSGSIDWWPNAGATPQGGSGGQKSVGP